MNLTAELKNMPKQDRPGYALPGPSHPERMRDPDYIVRGYKAALFNRSTSDAHLTTPLLANQLMSWKPYLTKGDTAHVLS